MYKRPYVVFLSLNFNMEVWIRYSAGPNNKRTTGDKNMDELCVRSVEKLEEDPPSLISQLVQAVNNNKQFAVIITCAQQKLDKILQRCDTRIFL